MNISGWIQLILFVAVLLAITKPLGLYLCKVLDVDGKTFLDPVRQAAREADLQAHRRRSGQGARLEAIHRRHADLQPGFDAVHLRHPAFAGRVLPFNPQKMAARQRAPGVQYRGELHHEHQLAELRWRIDDVLSVADGGARRFTTWSPRRSVSPSLRSLVRGIARHSREYHRQLLGRSHTRSPITCCCRICLVSAIFLVSQGDHPELQTL